MPHGLMDCRVKPGNDNGEDRARDNKIDPGNDGGGSAGDVIKEISPLWICRLDKLKLPRARPVLNIFLTLNCRLRRIELLEIDQQF